MRCLFILLCAVVSVGCVASHNTVVENVDVDWWGETKSFVVENVDTTTHRDIEIFVRYHPSKIEADSICLMVDISTPDTLSLRERVVVYLPSQQASQRSVCIVSSPYRRHVVWSEIGAYKIDISPVVDYSGVEAIGVNIVKSE